MLLDLASDASYPVDETIVMSLMNLSNSLQGFLLLELNGPLKQIAEHMDLVGKT